MDRDNDKIRARAAGITAMVAALIVLIFKRRRVREVSYDRDRMRANYLFRLVQESDAACVHMLRMNRSVFNDLCSLLRGRGLVRDTIHVTVAEQLTMFLHTIGHKVKNRVIGINFLRSGETVSRYFNNILYAIGTIGQEFVKLPSLQMPDAIRSNSRFMPFFKDCIGALDGTHIHARVPNSIVGRFRGRKAYPTQNVLAAVGFDMKFQYVLAGWKGSAHDANVLRDALTRDNGLRVPEGKYYLVDGGYATRSGFIAPYRHTRYHLNEFSPNNPPSNAKELFNLRHSSLRTTVERTFGLLKNRFAILDSQQFHPYRTQVEIVNACCILHNFIIDRGGDRYSISDSSMTSATSEECSDAQNSVLEIEEPTEWTAFRDSIARAMWEEQSR